MDVWEDKEQNEANLVGCMSKDLQQQYYENIDYQTLEKYNEINEHFAIIKVQFNQDKHKKDAIGYECIYKYEDHEIKLFYSISNGIWKFIPTKFSQEEYKSLNILLEDFDNTRKMSFDQQIQIIKKRFDHFFHELNQQNKKEYKNWISAASSIFQEDDETYRDTCFQSISSDSQPIYRSFTTPYKSEQIHIDSSCSSMDSIKYTQFFSPFVTSIQRRRIIKSIIIRVQRKKKLIDKIFDTLKSTSIESIIYQLGLEFLRIYDGKFNYSEGHIFIMHFENRLWILTIENIKCVECQLGESEPRSLLILRYKNAFISVQV